MQPRYLRPSDLRTRELSVIPDPPALVTCSLRWIPGAGVRPPGCHTTAQRPRTHVDTSRASHKLGFCVTTLDPKGYASLTLKAAHYSARIGRCSPSPDDVQMRAYVISFCTNTECPAHARVEPPQRLAGTQLKPRFLSVSDPHDTGDC